MIGSEDIPESVRDKIRCLKEELRLLRVKRDEASDRLKRTKRVDLTEEERTTKARLAAEKAAADFAVEEKEKELLFVVRGCKKMDRKLAAAQWNPNSLRKQAMRSQLYGHGADLSASSDE